MELKQKILKETISHYLKSHDFNGKPIKDFEPSPKDLSQIKELIKEGLISINYGDRHPNPHILAFEPEPIDAQLKKIETADLSQGCLYPTKKSLGAVVNKSKYQNKPFALMMALGEPRLAFRAFDLSVLELYRNDPRYTYDTDDIHGNLSIKSDFFEKGKMYKRDEVYLQTFGFAYTKSLNKRAVAVYVCYLADLSSEHQQFWYNKMLRGKYLLHPDYHRATMGDWGLKESIFTAFIEELHHINEMAKLMGKDKLFKEEYSRETKPKGFGFLIRPTLKEFNDFVHLLDKMMSENINKDFFKGMPLETEEILKDRRIKVIPKGTITLLEEWLKRVRFPDPKPKDEMLTTFRQVRILRQYPAHAVHDDVFDQKYFKQQRKLMIEAYGAVRTLRLIFANHPRVKGYSGIPEWLFKGEIWTF